MWVLSILSRNTYPGSSGGVLFFSSYFDSEDCGGPYRCVDGDEIFFPENAPKRNVAADRAIPAARPCLSIH